MIRNMKVHVSASALIDVTIDDSITLDADELEKVITELFVDEVKRNPRTCFEASTIVALEAA